MFAPGQSFAIGGCVTPGDTISPTPSRRIIPCGTKSDGLPPIHIEIPQLGSESASSGDGTTASWPRKESSDLSTSSWQPEGEMRGNYEPSKHRRRGSTAFEGFSDWSEENEKVWLPTVISSRMVLISHVERL